MCGRFTLRTPAKTLQTIFELPDVPELSPHYNVAPTDAVAVVRVAAPETPRELVLLRWGFVPSWTKDPSIGSRMINARSETVATSPAFRGAFRQRRCLVVADGFYEWQRVERRKQPFYFQMDDGRPFAFAGLWEHWEGPGGAVIDSCTLLTTEPNVVVQPIHNRMPVILAPEQYDTWLDPTVQSVDRLQKLLRTYPAEQMVTYPVGVMVNNPTNDDPDLVRPLPV